jgi:hypothetical protein
MLRDQILSKDLIAGINDGLEGQELTAILHLRDNGPLAGEGLILFRCLSRSDLMTQPTLKTTLFRYHRRVPRHETCE